MRASLVVIAVSACGYPRPDDVSPEDMSPDPPVETDVRFVDVTAGASSLRPGLYGFEVTAVLHNGLAEQITNVRPTLIFHQGTVNRDALFRWRDVDVRDGAVSLNTADVAAGADATFRFRVDALANAVLDGPVQIDGVARFDIAAGARSAARLDVPFTVPSVALPAPIVVNTTADEDNGNAQTSFREALRLANTQPGFDRITFAPEVFPADNAGTIPFDVSRGSLPSITDDLVIDATGAGVIFALDAIWNGLQSYALHLTGGTLLVHGIEFRDMGFQYPALSGPDNCDGGEQRGGAISVAGGTLILDGNRFSDSNVPERNCFASSVRISGGTAHRILNNHWTDQSMDAVAVFAPTVEISGNVLDAGSSANFAKTDDGIQVEALGGRDLWITGNLFIDHESSAVLTRGADDGTLYVVNNTFARTRVFAVRRLGLSRRIEMRNNAYHNNTPEALHGDGTAVGMTISHESGSTGDVLCSACTGAIVDLATVREQDLLFTNPAGVTRDHFTPTAGSPLIDTGQDLLDRNGSAPGRFHGVASDRGAIERTE